MKRLYLIDGSSYIFRAYFALPPLTGPNGMPTHAVYGVTSMLIKLLSETKAEYIGFVLDPPGRTFRDEIFAHYKATRPPVPADLAAQVGLVRDVVKAFRVPLLCEEGVEADDVIATLAARLPDDFECVVITADKDLMQLVGPRVKLWDTMRDRWVDVNAVREKFGVGPEQVVDVLALMGDSVDNVPGVKGVGEKTAVALVQHFGGLEQLYTRLDEVEGMSLRGAKKVAALLREGRESAMLSRELVTLRRDVPLPVGVEDLHWHGSDDAALRQLFSQLGFHTFARQLNERAPAPVVEVSEADDAAAVGAVLDRARAAGWMALACVCGEGPPATEPALEVVLHTQGQGPTAVPLANAAAAAVLRDGLARPSFRLIAHDWKRDLLALEAAGIACEGEVFDTMLASYLAEAAPSHGFEEVVREVLHASVEGFRAGRAGTGAGVARLERLAAELESRLREKDLQKLYSEVELPLLRVLERMERRGILIDTALLESMSGELAARLDELMREIHALAGGEFNINSPVQLREVLFERLKLPTRGVRKTKSGFSTDVDVLTRLAALHPLPARILDYRAIAKLKSTYVDTLPAAVNPKTGRLHTTFNQTVAATGRLSSSEPNLQNIPIRGEEGKRIRAAFIAPPGRVLLAADYSQIELRVLAHLSADPALLEAFRKKQDVHARTAAEVFGVLPGTVTPEMRRAAKVINFGILYGMGPQRLAHELDIPLAKAQEYISSYFERYSGVRSYMRSVVEQARETGFVTTLLGRRRAVPDIRSTDRGVAQAAERVAANTPIQGTAADIIKVAMIRVERRLEREGLGAALLLQVHDELLLEVEEGDREAVASAVREEMEGAMELAVPLDVDVGWGRSWGQAH